MGCSFTRRVLGEIGVSEVVLLKAFFVCLIGGAVKNCGWFWLRSAFGIMINLSVPVLPL